MGCRCRCGELDDKLIILPNKTNGPLTMAFVQFIKTKDTSDASVKNTFRYSVLTAQH